MSPAELDALALPPREQLRAALRHEQVDALRSFARFDQGYRSFALGFRAWIAAIHAFLVEGRGVDAAAQAVDAACVLEAASRHGITPDELRGEAPRAGALTHLDPDALLARFTELEERHRRNHDFHQDWVTALLSHVYRRHGVEELEACLRFAGEQTLLRWMPRDLSRPAGERVRRWAEMLLGNFARIRVEEDDEKFTIHQELCGSCGRQLQTGCYGAEPRFAIVEEPHPVTFNRGDVPVYRTHVAVMHYLLPIEKTGVPWPVVECPAGQATGPCRLLIYKDPARTPGAHWTWLGAGASAQ